MSGGGLARTAAALRRAAGARPGTRAALAAWLGLSLLFVVLDPPPSAGLALAARGLFWLLHIGLGLGLALLVARGLSRQPRLARHPRWLLLAAGLLGASLFAPLALWLEGLFPPALDGDDGSDLLDRWEARGGSWALLAEWLQLLPSYLAAWLAINLPSLGWASRPTASAASAAGSAAPTPPLHTAPVPPAIADPAEDWLASLPPAIGRELLRVSADLHYLHVSTRLGRATVLGSLQRVEAALAGRGLRIHRAHWVATSAVRRVARSGQGWYCLLHNGERLPVSRRRVAEVRAQFGSDFVVEDGSPAP